MRGQPPGHSTRAFDSIVVKSICDVVDVSLVVGSELAVVKNNSSNLAKTAVIKIDFIFV